MDWLQQIRNFTRWLWFILTLACILCIPFHKVFPVFPLALAGMAGGLTILLYPPDNGWRKNVSVLLTCAIWLLALYAYQISTNKLPATDDLQVKLPLLIIPLVVGSLQPVKDIEWAWFIRAMVIGCVAFIATAFGLATFQWLAEGVNAFNYKKLVGFTIIHPAYLGMFLNFALLIVLAEWMEWVPSRTGLSRLTLLLVAGILFIFLILLTAKTAVLFALMLLVLAAILYIRRTGNWLHAAWMGGGAILVFIVFLWLNPVTFERFSMIFLFEETSYENSVLSRTLTWKAVGNLVADMPLAGIGSGDVQEALNNEYKDLDFKLGLEESHNAHNQYFQVLLESGWPGLFVFVAVLVICLLMGIRRKDWLYTGFIMLFAFNILTESVLETQSGVLFFALFNTLFLARQGR